MEIYLLYKLNNILAGFLSSLFLEMSWSISHCQKIFVGQEVLLFLYFLNFILFIVVRVQLSPFSHHYLPPPPPPPTFDPSPFGFVHGSFIHVPWWPFSVFPTLSPPPSPLVTVSLFLISMSLIVFCLLICFVDYVPVKDDIIWYLYFTTWLTSLSIMLSNSIHAVMKGRSSYFLLRNVPLCECTIVFWSAHLLMGI